MKLYPHHTPGFVKAIYPHFTWEIPTSEKEIYLTFDDGPVPDSTSYALEQLDRFNVKATFFVVGQNVEKHPEMFQQLISNGHAVGNHTFNHISGWGTSTEKYVANVRLCDEILKEKGVNTALFRPPYGRIKSSQSKEVKSNHQVIMWSVLSGDFDLRLNISEAKKQLFKSKSGDIVVFHDNDRYLPNLKQLLPPFLQEYSDRGFKFKTL
jgi:peptidoglycan/xylan/chitin deacetylase (PgdA/CDA1 family)